MRCLLPLLGLALFLCPLKAEVAVPRIFSDHMVLQKAAKVPVWGKAEPNEKVGVTFGSTRAETAASENGKWQVMLDLSQAGAEPGVLVVEGKNRLEIKDVLLGEVWICSGQSNMEF